MAPDPPAGRDPRFRDNRFIVGGLVILLAILTVFYYLVQRRLGLTANVLANKVVLFVLWYVNIILILSILYVLVRSLLRLITDHRSRVLGSKFKTKLVLSAVALSLIPVLILFPFATRLLVDSLESWFNLPIEEVVERGRDTATALNEQIGKTNLRDARRVLGQVADIDLADLRQHPQLKQRIQDLRAELDLDYLAVYDDEAFIFSTADPTVMANAPTVHRGLTRLLRDAIEKGQEVRIADDLEVGGRLILAAAARARELPVGTGSAADLGGSGGGDESPSARHTVVLAGTMLPADLAEKSDSLMQAYQEYLKLKIEKDDLRATYLLILLMMTLLVILAFTSIGRRLAQRVTGPIQALAEGTHRIRGGDLDHRVEVAVDDELGVLVDGFNRMTRELKRNKALAEHRQEELLETNKLLDAVLENVAAGVLSIDDQGRILTMNSAAQRILAQRGTDLVGRHIDEAWADPQRAKLAALLRREAADDGAANGQIRMTVGGIWKTLEVGVTSLPDTSGKPGGRVVVLEDLTELIQAQKMATWTEVARRIAHEIKNPLTPIKLTAERLRRKHEARDADLGRSIEEGSDIIVREVDTLKAMVDEFSRFARMPRPQPVEVDLQRLVADTVGLYQGIKPGIVFEQRIAEDARHALFDPGQLKSVLINLLDNALQAMEPPGTVSITTERAGDHGGPGLVRLRLADTGTGIRDESKDKLFLPYFSTKGRGTGLGLAIVHRIVTDHHAAIHVEDNRPRGTVFVLDLPAQ